ncbi:hypothetical protein BJ508DRAFT_413126 [Ascobolus immersus RN42]|uniref:Calcium-dependent phosphotriesterase n=1 Tax=Ascobolus immersus RN42 TaxID=1160509 RepID=A0A3N4ICF5_ASCIM|nr:hypothetical protein BJ508DRAFT_413126 [Ascobolus immersus RN42]
MSVSEPKTGSKPDRYPSKTTGSAPRTARKRAPPADSSILQPHHIKLILLVFALSALYKSLSNRIPYFFSPTASPTSNTTCKKHHPTLLENCEDFRPIASSPGSILLSCDPARRQWQPQQSRFPESPQGSVYLWNINTPEKEPILIDVPQAGDDFHPLGLATFPLTPEESGPGGFDTRVFVIDHARKAPKVHVFDLNPTKAETRPIRVIMDARLNSPNSLVAENSTSFFVTNDGFFSRKSVTGLVLEAVSGWPLSEVVRVNFGVDALDRQGHPAVGHVATVGLGNGIEYDRERRTLWVASMTHGLYSFLLPEEREAYPLPLKGQWTKVFRTSMTPDNLMIAGRKLYVAEHGSLKKLFASSGAEDAASAPKVPSWVVSLELPPLDNADSDAEVLAGDAAWWGRKEAVKIGKSNGGLRMEEKRWEEVLEDDGSLYGSVTTGGVVSGKLVAVGLLEEGALVCEKA